MSKATSKELDELHALVARKLAEKIRTDTATPAEISAAIKFLQNNGIQANVVPGNPLDELKGVFNDLPFAPEGMPTQ